MENVKCDKAMIALHSWARPATKLIDYCVGTEYDKTNKLIGQYHTFWATNWVQIGLQFASSKQAKLCFL